MINYKPTTAVIEADYGDLLARPHLEAAIGDLSAFHKTSAKELRSHIKASLVELKAIKKSTTELSEGQLKELANRISKIYFHSQEEDIELYENIDQSVREFSEIVREHNMDSLQD